MRTLIALATLVGLIATPAVAEKLDFPRTGEKMFQITIPDNWEVDTDDDEIVEATSPEQNIALSIWEIESETTVESLKSDLSDLLKDYADEVTMEIEPRSIEVSGLGGVFMAGKGVDPDDAHELGFIAFALVKGEQAAIVYFEVDSNYSKEELKKFESIIESITTTEAK